MISGGFSFALFSFIGFKHLDAKHLFNTANLITSIRLGTVLSLSVLAFHIFDFIIPVIGLILMLLDCLDRWFSRREKTTFCRTPAPEKT